jgi:tetratricopeptide (TPR) repeat protein
MQSGEPEFLTANALHNLAEIFCEQRKYDEAESAYRRSIEITEEIFGSSSPRLAITRASLGLLYLQMERLDEARESFSPVYASRSRQAFLGRHDVFEFCTALAKPILVKGSSSKQKRHWLARSTSLVKTQNVIRKRRSSECLCRAAGAFGKNRSSSRRPSRGEPCGGCTCPDSAPSRLALRTATAPFEK